ncbi:MAG: DUF4190 domain-containing protein [Leifsonia sp.]|nr:DUF4190 domain-containing protein [Leifsonia sp.]
MSSTTTTFPANSWNTAAVAAFILAWFVAPAGLIVGFVALSQLKNIPQRGRALAIWAIVISLFELAAWIANVTVWRFFGMW